MLCNLGITLLKGSDKLVLDGLTHLTFYNASHHGIQDLVKHAMIDFNVSLQNVISLHHFKALLVFAMIDLDIQLVNMTVTLVDSESMSSIHRAADNSHGNSEACTARLC